MKKKEKKKLKLAQQLEFHKVMRQIEKRLGKTEEALKITLRKLDKVDRCGGHLKISPDVDEWEIMLSFLCTIRTKLEEADESLYYALETFKG